jgi:DNA-binding CsgD family transcriptional regulator
MVSTVGEPIRLLGRQQELRQVTAVISHARNGRGGTLLLAGEPGIGKTTLLEAATADLVGMRRVRVDGFEAESTMPFAAVQRLVTPLRAHLPALPDRHRHALEVATGDAVGPPPDRYLIGLGVLGLLAAAGETAPVVCAIDDAHLLDPESLDALAFVGRRLEAESAALVFAGRDLPQFDTRLAGVPTLRLTGLPIEVAVRLLMRSLPEPIDPAVAAQIAVATAGNPLALVDLAHDLTVKQLTESSFGDEPIPVGRHLEVHYLRQVRQLDADGQTWLLIAAADSTGNLDLIAAAAAHLELPDDRHDRAEAAGLVELGATVRFRHPLVRSAAYNAAPGRDRRRVHRALSVVAEKLGLTELAAWHAAKATLGTDEEVARRLEDVADVAAERGGFASRARVLVQASALTPPGSRRYARLVGAAEAAMAAGTAHLAKDLIDEVDDEALDPVSRGRLLAVAADHALFTAAPGLTRASADMLAAAELFHGHDPELEQTTLIKAWERALPAERLLAGTTWPELGRRLGAGAGVRDGTAATILRALSALVLLPYREAVPVMREAVEMFDRLQPEELLVYGHSSIALTTALWDDPARRRCLERTVAAARDAGSLQLLDTALWILSSTEIAGGSPRLAAQYLGQVRELRRAIGYDAEHVTNVAVLAWSPAAHDQVEAMADGTRAIGFGGVHAGAMSALAVVDLARGRYQEAYDRLRPLVDEPFLHVTPLDLPSLVEAAVRLGRRPEVVPVVQDLEERADANGSPWALGVAHRSRALISGAREAEAHFRAALEQLSLVRTPVDLGRAHLLYGEWLRRQKRRTDARVQLRAAAAVFDQAGADPFTERADRELAAGGDRPTRAVDDPASDLTHQERTVAGLAAAGRTNAEIGATMFLSVNTVDYHLRKVFQKLGVTSRRQLADRLGRP